MNNLRRYLASAVLCAGLIMSAPSGYAQDEIGATPNETAPDVTAPVETTPSEAAKAAKDLPPSVEDIPLPPAPPPGTMEDMPIAELQALDKITARVSHIEARINQTVGFGPLLITVKACRLAPPEDPPESAAFLEIAEQKPNEKPVGLYIGWMFASSPALAAMDHPIYDIWVTECRKEPLPVTASPVPASQ